MASVSDQIRVLIADDDAFVRSGLTTIIGGAPDLVVVGEACDGIEVVDQANALRPDIVLMDIRMPKRDGLAATKLLLQTPNAPRVLVLTTFDTDDSLLAALRAGAHGFLLKHTPPAEIVAAVRRVVGGDPVLSPETTSRLIASVSDPAQNQRRARARRDLAQLTEREHEVALAVGRGDSNGDIASALHLGLPTVKAHVSRIFAKLGVENRVQIAICVHDADLS